MPAELFLHRVTMKPHFLNSPALWTRSGSTVTDRTRYACAVEIPTRPSVWVRIATWLARWV